MIMATPFQDFVINLKEKLNIVEVAGGYFSLEKKGGTYWACCPFHHEKTPSFAVNEADQFYHCFGCGESGDVIKLVQNLENIEFMDAVKLLAGRVGMEVPSSGFDAQKTVEQKRKKDVILSILKDCAHFYLDNLNSGKADEHVQYILDRKIPSNIVRKFGLGASLNFNDLPIYLLKKGYNEQDIIDSGAVNTVDGRLIDSQGGRLIFPIINAMDEVIAFGGRVLKKTDFAKYKNTRETLVFNKGKSLYNINLLKKLKRSQTIKEVIMVEGYMDTISLYQAGFCNVVASMGTSLTQDQARLIKRYTDTVLISYDGDAAGQHANMRGLEILKNEGINVKVVPLPDGLDPDDVIKQLGQSGYQKCLDGAMPLIDFKLSVLGKSYNLQKTEEKRKFVAEAIKIIRTAESAAEEEDLLKSLRDATGITYESLKRDLNDAPVAAKPEKPAKPREDTSSTEDKASRFVIAAFLFGAEYTKQIAVESIPFTNDVHRVIAGYIRSKLMMEEKIQPAELFEFFDESGEEYAELCRILDYSDGGKLKGEVSEKYFSDCVLKLRALKIDREIASLKEAIDGETDGEKRKIMAQKLQTLILSRRKI